MFDEHFSNCRAAVDIAKGEQIYISYINPMQTTASRRAELKEGWNFVCNCDRCRSQNELGAFSSAVKCQKCSEGYLLPKNDLKMVCNSCSSYDELSVAEEDLEQRWQDCDRSSDEDMLQILQDCKTGLHPNHALATQIRSWLIPTICRKGRSHLSDFPISRFITKLELCRDHLKVLNIILPGLTLERGRTLFELQEAKYFIARSDESLTEMQMAKVVRESVCLLQEAGKCFNDESERTIERFFQDSIAISLEAMA